MPLVIFNSLTIVSNSLHNIGVTLIGLKFLGNDLSPLLCMGVTFAFLNISGRDPSWTCVRAFVDVGNHFKQRPLKCSYVEIFELPGFIGIFCCRVRLIIDVSKCAVTISDVVN